MRRTAGAVLGGLVAIAVMVCGPRPAEAAPRLSVSPGAVGAGGGSVTVSGSGYDLTGNGVYVAWCRVVPQFWSSQDRCGDAAWIHGQTSGTFSVTLSITPQINGHDCTASGACSVVTMNAHGSSDRGQDAFAAVSFASATAPTPTTPTGSPRSRTTTAPAAPTPKLATAAAAVAVSTTPARPLSSDTSATEPTAPVTPGSPEQPVRSSAAAVVAGPLLPAAATEPTGTDSPTVWLCLAGAAIGALGASGWLFARRRSS